jgi:hypothetical protein
MPLSSTGRTNAFHALKCSSTLHRGAIRGRFRRVDVAIVVRQDLVSDGAKIQLLAEQQTIKIHGEQSPVGPVSPSEFSKADIRGVIAQVGTLTMALQCEDVSS